MTLRSTHLTDEQLAECICDPAPAGVARHLDKCALCRNELASFRSSLSDFNNLTLLWAEKRAPARIAVPSRAARYWHRTPIRSMIAAGLIAAVFLTAARHGQLSSIPSVLHHDSSISSPASSSETASRSPADDDRLMLAIDRAIVAGQQSPVSAVDLGLPRTAGMSSSARNLSD